MRFITDTYENFLENRGSRNIILFGVSSAWDYYMGVFSDISSQVLDHALFIVDNDPAKHGRKIEINKRLLLVQDVAKLKEEDNYVILITVSLGYQKDICRQLAESGLPAHTECYSLPLMTENFGETDNACVEEYFSRHTSRMILPQIHSFWFSGEEKPELYKRCVDSWHKFCPEFEILEWNAQNYDVTKNQYAKEAFEHGKWAFVSDYARLDVMYRYGGVYMDMDVELTAPIAFLLNADSFFCRQHDGYLELGSGFGARAGDELIGKMLRTYENRRFIKKNGETDKTPQPQWLNKILKQNGICNCHDSQVIGNRLILSNDYIACYTDKNSIKKAKIGIHWHNGGWLDEKDRAIIRDSFSLKGELIKQYFNGKIFI